MANTQESTTLNISCACKAVTGSAAVPTSLLPLSIQLCHCNMCRHQTGMPAASFFSIPPAHASSFKTQGTLSTYNTSKEVIRYFCPICGTNIYLTDARDSDTGICTGALDNKDPGILKLTDQIFLSSCPNGGMGPWLPTVSAWSAFRKISEKIDCHSYTPLPPSKINTTAKMLSCHCECRSVAFNISRPSKASRDSATGPYSDLLKPYAHDPASFPENTRDDKWWLRQIDTRFLAGACACESCRKNAGFDIQCWAFVPKLNILTSSSSSSGDGEAKQFFDAKPEMLKCYRSSKGTYREFCAKCGATVFWHCDERSNLIDVSVGVMDAEEGPRAEGWLEWWTERVSFEEDARDKELVSMLKAGLGRWGKMKAEVEGGSERE